MNRIQVCIPTYNRRHNLELCLQALANQTRQDFDIYVADDGSIDDTSSMIADFVNRKGRAVAYGFCGEHIGYKQCRARNKAARDAAPDVNILVFVDSDVLLFPDAIDRYYKDFEEFGLDAVILGVYDWGRPQVITPKDVTERFNNVVDELLPPIVGAQPHGMAGRDIRWDNFARAERGKRYYGQGDALACFGGNLGIARDVFNKLGGYWEELSSPTEDGAFGCAVWRAGVGIIYDREIQGYHVWHPRNIPEIQKVSAEDVPKIDARFNVGNCSDVPWVPDEHKQIYADKEKKQ